MSHGHTKAAAGLEGLEPLVGKWHTEGRQLEGPFGPASSYVAVDVFEWLNGGQFLVHHTDGQLDGRVAACVEVLGKRADGQLFAESFYSDGKRNDWLVEASGRAFNLSGSWPQSTGEALRVRYTATFEDAGNTLVGKWEHSRDGRQWRSFLEVRGTKAQPLPDSSIGT